MDTPIFRATNEETERQGAEAMERGGPESRLPYALEHGAADDAPAPDEEQPPAEPPRGPDDVAQQPDERVNDVPGPQTIDEVP